MGDGSNRVAWRCLLMHVFFVVGVIGSTVSFGTIIINSLRDETWMQTKPFQILRAP